MPRHAPPVNLSEMDRRELERWVAAHRTPQQVSQRCQIVLAAAQGLQDKVIADDLNLNLLSFAEGEGVQEHVNREVDVLLIGVAGAGLVTVDGEPRPFREGMLLLVPKGARRSTRALSERFAYLTCHRKRAGLWPTVG